MAQYRSYSLEFKREVASSTYRVRSPSPRWLVSTT